jgi:hypothetical protein
MLRAAQRVAIEMVEPSASHNREFPPKQTRALRTRLRLMMITDIGLSRGNGASAFDKSRRLIQLRRAATGRWKW